MSRPPYITGTQLATARRQLCAAMAGLGAAADALSVLEQIAINPAGQAHDIAAIREAQADLVSGLNANVIALDELSEFLALPVPKEGS